MNGEAERIVALDRVRGVAVLGILLLNIVGFAMPEAAYVNPRAYGGASGADLAVYLGNFLLFDGRMRGLFSFLFGASLLIVADRAEARGASAARVHLARMTWLFLFGMAHLWLVWSGDILHHYALIGVLAFALRGLPVPRLVILGAMLVALQALLDALLPIGIWGLEHGPPSADAARTLAAFRATIGVPDAATIAHDLAIHRSDYATILAARFAETRGDPLTLLLVVGPETLAYMLFGMAALRSGMLAGNWSRARYARIAALGFGVALPCYAAIGWWLVAEDFALFPVALGVVTLPVLLRPAMIVGWMCLILLVLNKRGKLADRIAAVGRMAFTNYLATSLICTTLFYGYGFGWYGHWSRAALYLVVAALWLAMLGWSQPWLARFRYGPFEWAWRTLARGRVQPWRRAVANHPQ